MAANSMQADGNAWRRPREDESDLPFAPEAMVVGAVVVTVIVNGPAELPFTVTLAGEIEQLACPGVPLHVRLIEPLNPFAGFSRKL